MSLFVPVTETRVLTFGSATSTGAVASYTGNPVRLVIPRQARRLERIVLEAQVTIATPTSTASRDALEGLLKEIRFRVSDKAGSQRPVIQAGAPALLSYHKRVVGKFGRLTAAAFGSKAAGSYTMFIPLHFRNPSMSEVFGHRTSIPLDSKFIGQDPVLEIDIGALADIGLSAGTFNITSLRAHLKFREVPDNIAYVPTELISNEVTWPSGGGQASYDFPANGWLAGFLLETFTSSTVRGDILNAAGAWKLKYGRAELQEFYLNERMEEDAWWSQDYPGDVAAVSIKNDTAQTFVNLWHDSLLGDAVSAGSCLNLYNDNSGDRAQLVGTSIVASATSRITNYKILTNDPATLFGA